MAEEVRGVIARGKGAPVEVTTILVPEPGKGEALVAIQACGVCHTDLHYREGGINDEFPFLLGHEAAGVVDAVGPDVTSVAPGDFVVLNWRAVCGECRSCRRGRPQYCFATHNATQKMTLTDGTVLAPALGIGAFAEKTLVAAGQCTKVDSRARPEVAGLLGCGVMAGLGAAMFTGEVGFGDSVAVFGCGGVGCAAIAGARLAGAATIIGVDIDPRKLELARQFGATQTVNSAESDPVEAIRALTAGNGADVCIEAVGNAKVMEQAFFARDLAGTLVQVGVPDARDAHRASHDRVLRSWRAAQAELVRGLPSLSRLPDADRSVSGTAVSTSTASFPRPSRSTTSRRPSTAWSGGRCCARWSSWRPKTNRRLRRARSEWPASPAWGRLAPGRVGGRRASPCGLRARGRGAGFKSSAQLDMGDEPSRQEGDEPDRRRDHEDGLDRLGVGGADAVVDRRRQLVQDRRCDARDGEPGRQLGAVEMAGKIADENVREDRTEDGRPEGTPDRAEEGSSRGGDSELGVGHGILDYEHEHLHHRTEAQAEHDHVERVAGRARRDSHPRQEEEPESDSRRFRRWGRSGTGPCG